MKTNHRHKAGGRLESGPFGWDHCVAEYPERCTGESHGGVVYIDKCSCGATREREQNGDHGTYGPWAEAGE